MKKIILLFLAILLSVSQLCARKKYVFLDIFNYPLYINGLHVGTTNQPVCIPTDFHSFEVVVKRGKRYYGCTIEYGNFRYDKIDISTAPRIQKPLYLSEEKRIRGTQKK